MSIKINDDKPANEDRLGRTNFVNNLYNLITNSEDILKENSLTIDINGKWGDGKTTVINLLKKKFKDDNDNSKYRFINFLKKIFRKKIKYKFIDFNAWEYSNKTDLTGVLIDTLNYETSGIIKKKLNSLKNGSVSFYNKFAIYSNIFFISIFIIFWLLFVIKNIFDINYTWVEEWCFIISYIFSIYSLIKYVYFLIKNKTK